MPGNRIYSCNYLYPVRSPYAYIPKNGTSMATPVVSGAAALVLQKYPDMCNLELKYRLWNSCEKGRYYDQRQGHGNLHVKNFLNVKKKYLTPMKICYMIAQVISDGRDFKADIII